MPITDPRNGLVKPRIQVDAALNALLGSTGGGTAFYSSGISITLNAAPKPGFVFVKWQCDGVDFSTSPSVNVVADSNRTMTAVFRPQNNNSPVISRVVPESKKITRVEGSNFAQSVRVIINGDDRSSYINSLTQNSITLKGKQKKLGLRAGDNTVQVISASGVASNVFILRL